MLEQKEIIKRLKAMMKVYGTPNAFVGKKTGLDNSTICRLLKDDINLKQENLEKLDKFLSVRGF